MLHSTSSLPSSFRDGNDDATISTTESLSLMMEQDCTTYACHDYLNLFNNDDRLNSLNIAEKITPVDRMRVVGWSYDIVDQCQLSRENVAMAMNMVDRYMSLNDNPQDILYHRGQYQLLIITALYVSIKINESVTFPSSEFANVTHGMYSMKELEAMERRLLQGLNWRLCIPTPQKIGSQILELLQLELEPGHDNASKEEQVTQGTFQFLKDELAFQTQNAVRGYYFTPHRASTIAAISILNAIEQQVNDADYEILMRSLIGVLKQFDFVEAHVLLEARHQLRCLIDEEGDDSSSQATNFSYDAVIGNSSFLQEEQRQEELQEDEEEVHHDSVPTKTLKRGDTVDIVEEDMTYKSTVAGSLEETFDDCLHVSHFSC